MIHLMSQRQAERAKIKPGLVQSISPFLNPAHVLTPPRNWLESLLKGEYSWHFFRLRYKNMLRNRYREEPEPFHSLLDASTGEKPLYLTCHCLADHCHREIAAEFLETLRGQEPYRKTLTLRLAPPVAAPSSTQAPLMVANG